MADHTVNVCDDWNGSQGNKVTFVNNTGSPCNISQDSNNTWPFKDGPPLPTIPPGGSGVTHLKNPLANNTYTYAVDCCSNQVPKTVTVP
jgi:hypothetical protein